MRVAHALLVSLLLGSAVGSWVIVPTFAQSEPAIIEFAAGLNTAEFPGSVIGKDGADYVISANKGQVISVSLASASASVNFNVLPPKSEEAIFIGSIYGTDFVGEASADGDYTIRVYQMGAAADDGQKSDFTLTVGLDAVPLADETEDVLVDGTDFNATGDLSCSFEATPDAASCPFGVKRNEDGSASIFVTTPNGFIRRLDFKGQGMVSAPGDNTAVTIERQDDNTIVDLNRGEEVYTIPDAVITGG